MGFYLLVAVVGVADEIVDVVLVLVVNRWRRRARKVVGLDVGRSYLVEERLLAQPAIQLSTIDSTHPLLLLSLCTRVVCELNSTQQRAVNRSFFLESLLRSVVGLWAAVV
jgi:hypothetical protein